MAVRGCLFTAKVLPVDPKQRNASDTTRPDEVETNLIRYGRAVAAATGRRFKSSRPDVAARIGKFGYIRREQR